MTTVGAIQQARAAEATPPNMSHLGTILGVETVVMAIAMTVTAARLYVRFKMTRSVGRDDWAIAGAAVCALATWILFVYQGTLGLGHHLGYISVASQSKISEAEFWQIIISSCLGMALLKSSVALSLLRLNPGRWYVLSLWLMIVFVIAYSFMGAMTFFLYCNPMKAYWDHTIKDAKCYSLHLFITFALINTSFTIFTDVVLATIPIPIVWKLQMKRRVRLYLIGILSLGYVAVGFGIANAVYQIAFSSNVDSYFNDSIMFYAVLQVNMGIIAASAPTLKPLVGKALNLSSYTNSRGNGNYPSRYGSHYGSQSRSRPRRDQYAMDELNSIEGERRSDEVGFRNKAAPYSATVTSYKGSSSDSPGRDEDPASGNLTPPHDRDNMVIFVQKEIILT